MQSKEEIAFYNDLAQFAIKHKMSVNGSGNIIEGKFVITFRRNKNELEPSNGTDISEGSKGE